MSPQIALAFRAVPALTPSALRWELAGAAIGVVLPAITLLVLDFLPSP
jgi:hypothetical protein